MFEDFEITRCGSFAVDVSIFQTSIYIAKQQYGQESEYNPLVRRKAKVNVEELEK